MPNQSMTVMTAAVPRELHDRAQARAEMEDRSIASVMRNALKLYLAEPQPTGGDRSLSAA